FVLPQQLRAVQRTLQGSDPLRAQKRPRALELLGIHAFVLDLGDFILRLIDNLLWREVGLVKQEHGVVAGVLVIGGRSEWPADLRLVLDDGFFSLDQIELETRTGPTGQHDIDHAERVKDGRMTRRGRVAGYHAG